MARLSSLPRVVYCGQEDPFFKKLSAHVKNCVLEARSTQFSGSSPQKLARAKKASVLIVPIKSEVDLRLQEWLARNDATVPVIVVCKKSRIETAINVLQYGAFDYFSTDQSIEVIARRVSDAIRSKSVKPVRRAGEPQGQLLLHGSAAEINKINQAVSALTADNRPLMVYGETGTGKEHLAHSLYRMNFDRGEPFARYDCRLLKQISRYDGEPVPKLVATTMQEIKKRCNRGVLFLKHFEELSTDQMKEIVDRGSRSSAVKLVTSFQEPLAEPPDPSLGASLLSVHIPALRCHTGDIPVLAEHFIHKTAQKKKIRAKSLSSDIVLQMQQYPWPGNVQELENVIERMMQIEPSAVLTSNTWSISQGYGSPLKLDRPNQLSRLIEEILDNSEAEWTDGNLYEEFMERMKRMLIELVLPKADYNQATAAKILGISRNTLREKIK